MESCIGFVQCLYDASNCFPPFIWILNDLFSLWWFIVKIDSLQLNLTAKTENSHLQLLFTSLMGADLSVTYVFLLDT